ncbi:aldehyde dehydrogenase family protein [Ornithinicoccus hortensis]|uniref:Acyl-CoA reductase-like NAD-dependent aldehyde dehydrogenase n=1 Tax=Ornithinicoccus hortensis TaxID=82346 RepID=A0A542YVJ5_9MICO|nr:aldehyde dehydrogenase family protein [Ornithinicoccus hortensis]TQL51994.1 acyl-CoA reductase-like NAD-dependent aldehyde dehydrogenase [Ornithinicoccus hortensis]
MKDVAGVALEDIEISEELMYIGGEWVPAEAGETIEVITPIDRNKVIATTPRAREADADKAVAAARAAFPAWANLTFAERSRALHKCTDALEEAVEELAHLTALDTGNAIRTQARPEAGSLVSLFRYMAGIAGEVKGTVLPTPDNQLQYTRRQPLGVVAGILPWNSPLLIAAFKVPAALAAGNTIVLKAAEDAPLTILKLAEIIGPLLPAGVLNVVTGLGAEIGEALVVHQDVDKVSFTGSSLVGHGVASKAGARLAHASLELGGKSPSIVYPDSCTDEVVDQVLAATRFARQGQSCTSGSRLFLHDEIHDEFLEKLVAKTAKLKVGNPREEESDIGCIINAKQYDRVQGYIDDGLAQENVAVAFDGREQLTVGEPGFYHAPMILTQVSNDWRIAQEEIFGPILSVIRWKDEDEVIKMANDTHYGLAAFVFSKDISAALRAAHRIDSGWVQVNQGGGQLAGQSYGGMKTSGIGREVSLEGMLEGFTQIKQINVAL